MNAHLCSLDKILNNSFSNPNTILVISNASIKNNVTTSLSHIYSGRSFLAKAIHHAVNVTSTEAELFSIRCGINQAVQVPNIECIIVITDAIHATRYIFDSSSHPYQLQSIAISQDLRAFFNKSSSNSITFWNCPSSTKWPLHSAVDKETKQFKINPIFPCKLSWDFSEKEECNSIIHKWQMTFQVLGCKGRHFLNLNNNVYLPSPLIQKIAPGSILCQSNQSYHELCSYR